jgi:hypothetical protein
MLLNEFLKFILLLPLYTKPSHLLLILLFVLSDLLSDILLIFQFSAKEVTLNVILFKINPDWILFFIIFMLLIMLSMILASFKFSSIFLLRRSPVRISQVVRAASSVRLSATCSGSLLKVLYLVNVRNVFERVSGFRLLSCT